LYYGFIKIRNVRGTAQVMSDIVIPELACDYRKRIDPLTCGDHWQKQ
jgi:hypothetical protein